MRITGLYKRNWKNRFSYWLYTKWCNEPYFPDGDISAYVVKSGDTPAEKRSYIRMCFTPKKFTPGVHEALLYDGLNANIKFLKDLFDKHK